MLAVCSFLLTPAPRKRLLSLRRYIPDTCTSFTLIDGGTFESGAFRIPCGISSTSSHTFVLGSVSRVYDMTDFQQANEMSLEQT